MPAGELTQEFLLASVRELIDADRQIRTMDLKSQIKLLYPMGVEPARRVQFDDLEIMEYLLNPLKHEYVYEDLAKDYLNRMYPTRTDLLGKMTIKKAIADDGEKEALHKWIGSLMATICDAFEPMMKLLEEQGIEWSPEDTARPSPRRERGEKGDGERRERRDRGDRPRRNEHRDSEKSH